jgi:hypothetical protein
MLFYSDAAPSIVSGQTTITLANFAKPDYSFDEHDYILHKSVITGKRTIYLRGHYFTARIHVFGMSYADYNSLRTLDGTAITFYPYGSGNITINNTTYTAPSITCIMRCRFYHLNERLWTDAVILDMESESYANSPLNLQTVGS